MRQYRVGSAFDIPIRVDLTLLVILPVLAAVIGLQVDTWARLLGRVFPVDLSAPALRAGPLPWVLGAAGAVGLFLSVLVHELGHALAARRYGVRVTAITLWVFGGIASLERTPRAPARELVIALAGPAVSLGCALGAGLTASAVPSGGALATQTALFLLGYLAVMNAGLAAFNMLPAFPMDGGRVLRALLARSRPHPEATALAALVGKAVAVLLGLLGAAFVNPILLGVAVFVYVAAGREARRTAFQAALEDIEVADLMTPADSLDVVEGTTSVEAGLETLFDERLLSVPVRQDGRVVGTVGVEDLRAVERAERDARTVGDVHRDVGSVRSDAHPREAMRLIERREDDQLLVVEGGEFAGVVTRADLRSVVAPENGQRRGTGHPEGGR